MTMYLGWPYILAYASYLRITIISLPFYSKKKKSLDLYSKLYHHSNSASLIGIYEFPYILYTCLSFKMILAKLLS